MTSQITTVAEALKHPEIFRVSIFGSARTQPGDEAYEETKDLAFALGKKDIGVITGGGPGQMEAANTGHQEARSKNSSSIGFTIHLPFEAEGNEYMDVQKHFMKFGNRLDHFMSLSNAVVITPGGIGTCLELFYTLQLTQVKHINPIPIILMDPMWHKFMALMHDEFIPRGYVSPEDLNNVYSVNSLKQCIDVIDHFKDEFDQCEGEMCSNIEKYKVS